MMGREFGQFWLGLCGENRKACVGLIGVRVDDCAADLTGEFCGDAAFPRRGWSGEKECAS